MDAIQKLYKVKTQKHTDMFEKVDLDERMSTILTSAEQEDVKNLYEVSNILPFCCLN